jgi:SEC-C motif-containing protein
MRSRYSAYTQGDIDYIERTHAPETRASFDATAARDWAARSDWLGLEIVSTEAGHADGDKGVVSFAATYRQAGQTIEHREVSRFRRTASGAWLFVDGDTQARPRIDPASPVLPNVRRETPKVGRNDPCPCGSGRKFKKCCGA